MSPHQGRGRRRIQSLASSDLAILVYAVAVERYASRGGYVALLAPKSLVTADPGGRAFRQFHWAPHAADRLDASGVDLPFAVKAMSDYSLIKPFSPDAANQPILLIARTGERQSITPVRTKLWRRAAEGARLNGRWPEVRLRLHPDRGESTPVGFQRSMTSAWRFLADGAPPLIEGGEKCLAPSAKGELDTRGANGIYFLDVLDDVRPDGSVLVANRPGAGRARTRPAPPRREFRVAADLVWPLLRGQDVARWSARPEGYILCPHNPADLGRPLSAADLRARAGDTYRFVRTSATISWAGPPTKDSNPRKTATGCFRAHFGGWVARTSSSSARSRLSPPQQWSRLTITLLSSEPRLPLSITSSRSVRSIPVTRLIS